MAAVTALAPDAVFHATDNNGNLLAGGQLYTYSAGTMTKLATYTDATGATPNTNPIILNSRGECGLWLTPGIPYKLILSPAGDTDPPSNPIWSVDNVITSGVTAGYAASISYTLAGTAQTLTAAQLQYQTVKLTGTLTSAFALSLTVGIPGEWVFFNQCSGAYNLTLNTSAAAITGTSTGSNTSTTLNDTTKAWTTNAFAGGTVQITGGTGSGQTNTILSNTAMSLTVLTAWGVTPDATSTYSISYASVVLPPGAPILVVSDGNAVYASGSGAAVYTTPSGTTFLGAETHSGAETHTGAASFTAGSITVPTKNPGDNSSNAASTSFVTTAMSTIQQTGNNEYMYAINGGF